MPIVVHKSVSGSRKKTPIKSFGIFCRQKLECIKKSQTFVESQFKGQNRWIGTCIGRKKRLVLYKDCKCVDFEDREKFVFLKGLKASTHGTKFEL